MFGDAPYDLDQFYQQAHLLLPECVLLVGSIVFLFLDLLKLKSGIIYSAVLIGILLIVSLLSIAQQIPLADSQHLEVWNVLIIDRASFVFQLIFLTTGALYGMMLWRRATGLDCFLALSIILGAFITVKAINLLVLLLSIEILSICAYTFTARQEGSFAREAALKYVIFGAASTAIFLFGLSLLFGLTGDLNINSVNFVEQLVLQDGIVLGVIITFILAGLLFKITGFPFHLWAPDVYQSVPAPLAAFFSIIPKLAVTGFMIKFFMIMDLFGRVEVPWQEILGIIAIVTMTIGNLAALSQDDPQRMLAYSSIAHTGFLLLGIAAFHSFAFQAVLFYSIIYMLMNVAAFLFIDYSRRKHNIKSIDDFRGRFDLFPVLSILFVVVMVSLTGLPPTAGFTSKLFIFSALWQFYQDSDKQLFLFLMVAGILNTILSLFYYLKIPYFLIFKKPEPAEVNHFTPERSMNFLYLILVLPLIILFIWPDILMDWINMVNFAL